MTWARKIENVVMTIGDRLASPPDAREAALAERLRGDLAAFADQAALTTPFWQETADELARLAATTDPRLFKRWPRILETMVYRTTAETRRLHRNLRANPRWQRDLVPRVRGREPGGGPPFLPDPRVDPAALHHATHLEHFLAVTGRALTDHGGIAEFGGGYGSMCRFVRRLGFAGRYVVFDLPPVLALQRYFLGLNGLDAVLAAEGANVLTHDLEETARRITPDTALLSTWAMSEMPLPLRADIERFLDDPRLTGALFAYSRTWRDLDNAAYFEGLVARHASGWTWRLDPIDDYRFYLVGIRPR